MITTFEADVLSHTSKNGRYVTGDARVIEMAERGLLHDYGPQRLADGDHYLKITIPGEDALREWRAAQPPPLKRKKRRLSPAFESWMTYREVYRKSTFPEFLKEVWPHRKEYQ